MGANLVSGSVAMVEWRWGSLSLLYGVWRNDTLTKWRSTFCCEQSNLWLAKAKETFIKMISFLVISIEKIQKIVCVRLKFSPSLLHLTSEWRKKKFSLPFMYCLAPVWFSLFKVTIAEISVTKWLKQNETNLSNCDILFIPGY